MLHIFFRVALFSGCNFSASYFFHLVLFACCTILCAAPFSCCTFFVLHSFFVELLLLLNVFHVALFFMLHHFTCGTFLCYTFSVLLQVALTSCSTCFVSYPFRVAKFLYCNLFTLCFFALYTFRFALFSCCTIFE